MSGCSNVGSVVAEYSFCASGMADLQNPTFGKAAFRLKTATEKPTKLLAFEIPGKRLENSKLDERHDENGVNQ